MRVSSKSGNTVIFGANGRSWFYGPSKGGKRRATQFFFSNLAFVAVVDYFTFIPGGTRGELLEPWHLDINCFHALYLNPIWTKRYWVGWSILKFICLFCNGGCLELSWFYKIGWYYTPGWPSKPGWPQTLGDPLASTCGVLRLGHLNFVVFFLLPLLMGTLDKATSLFESLPTLQQEESDLKLPGLFSFSHFTPSHRRSDSEAPLISRKDYLISPWFLWGIHSVENRRKWVKTSINNPH